MMKKYSVSYDDAPKADFDIKGYGKAKLDLKIDQETTSYDNICEQIFNLYPWDSFKPGKPSAATKIWLAVENHWRANRRATTKDLAFSRHTDKIVFCVANTEQEFRRLLWATDADEPSYDYALEHKLCSGEDLLVNLSMTQMRNAHQLARKLTDAGAAVTNPVHITNILENTGRFVSYVNVEVVKIIVSNPRTPIDMKIKGKPLIQAFALDSEELAEVCVELARRGQHPNSGTGITCATECTRRGWHDLLAEIEQAYEESGAASSSEAATASSASSSSAGVSDKDRLQKLERLTKAIAHFLAVHWEDAKELSEIRLAANALGWKI